MTPHNVIPIRPTVTIQVPGQPARKPPAVVLAEIREMTRPGIERHKRKVAWRNRLRNPWLWLGVGVGGFVTVYVVALAKAIIALDRLIGAL